MLRKRLWKQHKKYLVGELKLNPARWPDTHTALQYSPYKEIMQFDEMLPENNYHKLANYTAKEVLEMLKEEGDQHEQH